MKALVRVLMTGMMMAALPQLVRAQERPLTGPEELEQKRRGEAAEVEKAYKRVLKNTQSDAAATKSDPWGSIRAPDTAQVKQSTSSKSTK
jgi:DnaJ-domain-containing protein 1